MGLDNTLNVSELLRRLGVKGDSLGSAPVLESLRLSLSIADLSYLVPPLGVPIGWAGVTLTSGVATFNKWSLRVQSPGGAKVLSLGALVNNRFNIFVTDLSPFGAPTVDAGHNFSFGQAVVSSFSGFAPAALAAPLDVFEITGARMPMGPELDNWIGPGQFFNIESRTVNTTEKLNIVWKEYPGALNP